MFCIHQVPMARLQLHMCDTLRIDNFSPCALREGGALYPAVCSSYASMIMYYEDRSNHGHMTGVLQKMRNALGNNDSHRILMGWSATIRTEFEKRNAELRVLGHGNTQGDSAGVLAKAFTELNKNVMAQNQQLATLHQDFKELREELKEMRSHLAARSTSDPNVEASQASDATSANATPQKPSQHESPAQSSTSSPVRPPPNSAPSSSEKPDAFSSSFMQAGHEAASAQTATPDLKLAKSLFEWSVNNRGHQGDPTVPTQLQGFNKNQRSIAKKALEYYYYMLKEGLLF